LEFIGEPIFQTQKQRILFSEVKVLEKNEFDIVSERWIEISQLLLGPKSQIHSHH
jgi:hypothetical protein|tara:strand:- start:204 stop:368 length:165 start_codon:yes stop_codon:yes gene_type:complete